MHLQQTAQPGYNKRKVEKKKTSPLNFNGGDMPGLAKTLPTGDRRVPTIEFTNMAGGKEDEKSDELSNNSSQSFSM
jgi:hypothetical protein